MTATSRRQWIRQQQGRFPRQLHIERGSRGVYVGKIGEAIKAAAEQLGIPVSNARDIRLQVASAVFAREIHSYNQLEDAELWALHQWVILGDVAIHELVDWLKANYGEQMALLPEVA